MGAGAAKGIASPAALSMVKLLAVTFLQLPFSYAAPLITRGLDSVRPSEEADPKSPQDPDLWVYLGIATALVLLGGAFAGLTIALMGQDEIYLQVIATSGEGAEKKNAGKVLNLLKKGKHWVLVTLLLSNVITNETLPIVLDRSLGGGWPAVLSSTVLIVIFGEIVPQSICVRYGLPIGAFMAPGVLALMWLMAPVAWPTAKLLDWLLGEDHGTTYKKAGLKTLVTLHKTLGTVPGERLNEDEVTIITAVLDLKEKPVGSIMTPMQDVFTMSADTVLDEKMMDTILSQGYSRIPIYAPENPRNYIGMLLVKILITYDPEDCLRVRDFALATLPETAPETSCLDIVNFFQEGKSHMVLVSDFPGQDKGALGVVTLEDVIEELIGEEIIDESDVFVDVHKAIRRMAPAPHTKYDLSNDLEHAANGDDEGHETEADEETRLLGNKDSAQKGNGSTTLMVRRRSSNGSSRDPIKPIQIRSNTADLRQHLKHLGPSNVASRPKATKYTSVKIKPGVQTIPEGDVARPVSIAETDSQRPASIYSTNMNGRLEGGAGAGLVGSAGKHAKDGTLALAQGYGTIGTAAAAASSNKDGNKQDNNEVVAEGATSEQKEMTAAEASAFANGHTLSRQSTKGNEDESKASPSPTEPQRPEKIVFEGGSSRPISREGQDGTRSPQQDTLGEIEGPKSSRPPTSRATRSGSITENIIDVGGMKKVVLEANSSSDNDERRGSHQLDGTEDGHDANGTNDGDGSGTMKKKKKKKRAGKKFRNKEGRAGSVSGDSSALLNQRDD